MRRFLLILCSVSLLSACVGLGLAKIKTTEPNPPQESHAHFKRAYDPSDKRQLVGFASHVFLGEVQSFVGSADEDTDPKRLHAVRVDKVLKGSMPDSVVVASYEIDDQSVGLESPVEVEQGKVYLFSARFEPELDAYVLAGTSASTPPLANSDEIANAVREYQTAVASQIDPAEKSRSEDALLSIREQIEDARMPLSRKQDQFELIDKAISKYAQNLKTQPACPFLSLGLRDLGDADSDAAPDVQLIRDAYNRALDQFGCPQR